MGFKDLAPQKPDHVETSNITKAAAVAVGAGVLAVVGLSLERTKPDSFKTDIPVPTEKQPHIDYVVKPGDTEESITKKFDLIYDKTAYENMINNQLPKSDQGNRTLQPGENINLPPVTS